MYVDGICCSTYCNDVLFYVFIITNVFQLYHLQRPESVPAILGGADACHACCKYCTYLPLSYLFTLPLV